MLTHQYFNGGRSKHANSIYLHFPPPSVLNNTDATCVIVYFCPQTTVKMCVKICPPIVPVLTLAESLLGCPVFRQRNFRRNSDVIPAECCRNSTPTKFGSPRNFSAKIFNSVDLEFRVIIPAIYGIKLTEFPVIQNSVTKFRRYYRQKLSINPAGIPLYVIPLDTLSTLNSSN